MPRPNKIWYRKDRKTYFVTIDGKLYNLGKDKRAAEKAYHTLMLEGPAPPVERISAAELMDRFLIWCRENRAKRTYEWYLQYLQDFLDSLANQENEASRVRPLHLNEWVAKKGWSKSSTRGALIAIQRAFNWGAKQGYIDRSPLQQVEKPRATRRDNCPSPVEIQELIQASQDNFRDVLVFACETGARPQEISAIEKRHFDGGKIIFPKEESKGKRSARVIHLTKQALAIVIRRIENCSKFIFTNKNGNRWTAYAMNCQMSRIAKKTGKKFALYDLRHAFATRMLESGLDHITVSKLMGHADATMLARVYQHIGEQNDFLQQQLNRVSEK
ncbi:tyrosine-type recombinase/integrase [Blastopirellula marina]|uniref:Integrase n=1 Tax=Blastopirellula marina TaxID=124 RepID=A0A2S8GN91_9BACT|nr:site-specific integrase [Blastopirellula marina]PQO45494.1 hypothetical protein C5Y93_13675 [Blastopirellula marina]